VRTWAYCTHRADWIGDAVHWQAQAHELEERLSDALHDRLLQRFVDQRTSVLARALNAGEDADAVVLPSGEVKVLEHTIGHLEGLSFRPGSAARDLAGKTLRMVASAALAPEINRRLAAVVAANDEAFHLADDGTIHWEGAAIARLKTGSDALHPLVMLIGGQLGHEAAQDKAQTRIQSWLDAVIARDLKPLLGLRNKVDDGVITGLGRGLGFRLIEAMGALPRHQIASELRDLDQPSRHALRQCGVRFGAFHVFMPALIRPAPARLLSLLFAAAAETDIAAFLPRPGLTAYVTQESVHAPAARVAGYALFSRRLVRIDILERLADLIREAQKAHKGGVFAPNEAMLSLLGCSHDDLGKILIELKYKCKRKKDEEGKGEAWAPMRVGHKKQAKKKAPEQKSTIDPDSPFAVLQALK
jgi:ATP-dependent RNA helicase SUPV3L1/SUV3